MKMLKLLSIGFWFVVAWQALVCSASAQTYVEVTTQNSAIRNGPTTRATLVVRAKEGDIFQWLGESDNWYEIHLFSGGSRFIHKNLVRQVPYKYVDPDSTSVVQERYAELVRADRKARSEADRRYPPDRSLERNLDNYNLLKDRYTLEAIHELGIPPADYRRVMIEGMQNEWEVPEN